MAVRTIRVVAAFIGALGVTSTAAALPTRTRIYEGPEECSPWNSEQLPPPPVVCGEEVYVEQWRQHVAEWTRDSALQPPVWAPAECLAEALSHVDDRPGPMLSLAEAYRFDVPKSCSSLGVWLAGLVAFERLLWPLRDGEQVASGVIVPMRYVDRHEYFLVWQRALAENNFDNSQRALARQLRERNIRVLRGALERRRDMAAQQVRESQAAAVDRLAAIERRLLREDGPYVQKPLIEDMLALTRRLALEITDLYTAGR